MPAVTSQNGATMRSLRVGIISANWGAIAHLPAWRAVPGVEVIGICTSRRETAEAAAQKLGIEHAYWSAEAMTSDAEIDIVDCGTRPALRHAMVLSALERGKHVYNGIPFAVDLEHARQLHAAWQQSGRTALVDAFSEWVPAHHLARQWIEGGQLGELFGGTCSFNLSLFNKPNPRFPYNWFAQAEQGVSALRNLGSHALHMLVFLFGEVEELVAHDTQLLKSWQFPDGSCVRPQTNDYANALLRFKTGFTLQLQVSWSATLGAGWRLEAFGSKGRLVTAAPSFPTARDTTLQAGTLESGSLSTVEIPEHLLHAPQVRLDAHAPMPPAYPMALAMHNMVEAIRGKATARPDFGQAWYVERLLEAIRRSSAERRWVRTDEIN
jgi:predicted dehydrogenase